MAKRQLKQYTIYELNRILKAKGVEELKAVEMNKVIFKLTREDRKKIQKALEADKDKVSRQIFNVGDNDLNVTISDLAKTVKKVVSKADYVEIRLEKNEVFFLAGDNAP